MKSRGARNQQVGRAGEYFVTAELNRRGAFAVPFAGNMPKIDLMACNEDQSRRIQIQVKTKRVGNWHSSMVDKQIEPPIDETNYWVFVDLGEDPNTKPRYWIVPNWWIVNDIYKAHNAYLARHDNKRARNPDSKHHSIDERRLNGCNVGGEGRWDILGILPMSPVDDVKMIEG